LCWLLNLFVSSRTPPIRDDMVEYILTSKLRSTYCSEYNTKRKGNINFYGCNLTQSSHTISRKSPLTFYRRFRFRRWRKWFQFIGGHRRELFVVRVGEVVRKSRACLIVHATCWSNIRTTKRLTIIFTKMCPTSNNYLTRHPSKTGYGSAITRRPQCPDRNIFCISDVFTRDRPRSGRPTSEHGGVFQTDDVGPKEGGAEVLKLAVFARTSLVDDPLNITVCEK